MSDLPSLLLASLNPATRKAAEQNLNALSVQEGFLSHLPPLILDATNERPVRLAGSVFLKNIAKLRWEEDTNPLSEADKASLRAQLVPAMLVLSTGAGDKAIRAQTAESISLIAELDFPAKWPDLIGHLISSLSPTSSSTNIAILQTSHSIFSKWRAHVCSDALFTEINLVLTKFMEPFLGLFRHTAALLLSPPPTLDTSSSSGEYAAQAQTMALLVEIFYDFTCQDLPPAIEGAHAEFFSPPDGWFQKLLDWNPAGLSVDPDETTASLPSQVKTGILQIAELFLQLYPEQLQQSPVIESFIQGLVSQSLRFLSATIRSNYTFLFSASTLSTIIQSIIVPNVLFRVSDEEMFSDDPLEFIRLSLFDSASTSSVGLTSGGADGWTRRQAAADVLKALVGSGFERETTAEVEKWVQMGLAQYNSATVQDRVEGQGWKAKDGAIYLMMAVATRGSTSQLGVTSTNALVDVVQFFSSNIFGDLEAQEGSVHPILQVDAIRFLLSFRNQLTKPQLLSVLPLLVRHLASQNYVTYTYAAITIDRILSIRRDGANLFAQADIHDLAPNLLATLLSKIESAGTAEKVAENDHLMKSAVRVIFTARQTLTPGYEQTLGRLIGILELISKNPSNPLFDQYIFESISGLMRFVVEGTPATLAAFENALFGPFTIIIQQDIEQYIPYVFQLLAQMLSLHSGDVPTQYRPLLPLLFTPASWQQKGSIPGLVKLLKAFLARDSIQMMASNQIASVLAVVQQRLIPSKLNDVWGFELLQEIVMFVRPGDLRQYFTSVVMTLLTRMQSSKTDKFVYLFSKFLLYCMAIDVEGLGPDYVVDTIDEIQPRLWSQILTNFVVPQVPLMPQKDRKLAVIGLTRLLTRSRSMMLEPNVQLWPPTFTSLVQLFRGQYLAGAPTTSETGDDTASVGITDIDQEKQAAGYQAAYSRLAASETVEADPVAYVRDPEEYLRNELRELPTLLDFDKDEDLQRMYALLYRIPEGLEPLRKKFEEHVKKAGLAAVAKLVGTRGEANADAIDPKAYVDALLDVHKKNSETVTRSFRGEAGFVASLDKACREFVNRNAATGASNSKSPELLAKHADLLLWKNKMAEKDDLEAALNRVMVLFKYIEDKDVFQQFMWENFQTLLDFDKDEDLQRMYALLSRIPEGLEPLRKKFEEHVKKAGLAAVAKLVGTGGEANADAIDPKAYVDALLDVHKKNSETVTRSFRGEAGFVASLDKACREFVNRNAATDASDSKSPELLAKHADLLLRKNNKMAEKDDLEAALNRVMVLFKYIEDKDVFQQFYTTKLSKRLIHGVSASDESEASMISKLKEACGFEYTNKLQRMFTDMSLSKDLTDQFKDRVQQNHDDMDINFSIMVLGTNFWPLNPPTHEFVIPAEILATYDRFQKYYQMKHSGRKLTWLWNYSKNELRTNYLNQKYILMTSSFQMAVLLQYNRNDTLSLAELEAATGIPKELLTQVLALLVKAKVLVNEETEQYDLNPGFKSKKIRVNLNLPIKAEVKADTSDVLKTVDEDRKYVIQATIVRVMKARKTMKNQPLIQEVISQISQRFAPKIPDIKKAIDTLLEKEYVERVDGTRDTFAYVA